MAQKMGREGPLNILVIDDSKSDFLLTRRELLNAGIQGNFLQVETARDMEEAINQESWDVFISDCKMPTFSAREALDICKRHKCRGPFILFSGAVGEEEAVALLKSGADDFIRKDNLIRLPLALERCLKEAAERAKCQKAQEELAKHQIHLQELINERTADLKTAQEAAELANRSKSQFLANMSHEIRTPMNATIGLANLALRCDMNPQVHDYLTKIAYYSSSLLRIIDDILDFSKIEANKLELEASDFLLHNILDHLSDLFVSKAVERNVELHLILSPECRYALIGDALRLEQILVNLVSNALKFTQGGLVEVRVEKSYEAPDFVSLQFSVRDTGIGMSEEQVARLFQPFVQADGSTTRKYGGTGLGLTICKRLTEMMGGEIRVESVPDQGSTFYFTAGFKRRMEAETNILTPPKELQQLRVLVVDENPVSREMIRCHLDLFELHSHLVATSEEVMEAVIKGEEESRPFGLMVMAWTLPKKGQTILPWKAVNQYYLDHPEKQPPRTILLAPFGEKERIRNQENGVSGVIGKPVQCSILFDTIMAVFDKPVEKAYHSRHQTEKITRIMEKIRGARILLAEDNAINQQVAMTMLREAGLVVDGVKNGLEAVEMVREFDYDAVLMDIQMPEMDGLAATREIRKDPLFADLPVIAMTAHAMVGDREKSLEAGMNAHITKPVDRNRLFNELATWIKPKKRPFVSPPLGINPPANDSTERMGGQLPGIDLPAVLIRLNDDRETLRSLLLEFKRDYTLAAKPIRQALQRDEANLIQQAKNQLHTLKGMAGNLSATDLYSSCQALENAIMNNTRSQWPQLLDGFEKSLEIVLDSAGKFSPPLQTPPPTPEKPLNKESFIKPLQTLASCLKNSNGDAQDLFEELKPRLSGLSGEVNAELTALEEHLDRFSFKEALVSLQNLAEGLQIPLTMDVR